MKKRTAFIGAILSLIPFGQPLLIKTGVILSSAAVMLSLPEIVNANDADYYFELARFNFNKGKFNEVILNLNTPIKIRINFIVLVMPNLNLICMKTLPIKLDNS